ncbi:MAG: ABC transporter permease [Candidatus Acidiferrales bacterium]
MKFLDTLRFRIASWSQRSQMSAEAEDELRSHMQHRADDLERSGLSRAEAERTARLEFGGAAKFREASLEAAGGSFFDSIVQDLRYAVRLLKKSPGFTTVAVLTLALGIGANAVVFSVMNAAILKPLDLPRMDNFYALEWGSDLGGMESYPDYLDLRDRNSSFESLAAFYINQAGLDTGDRTTPAWTIEATGNYFDVLGVQPYLGRFFHASDEHGASSAPYIVLTYAYWHTHFAEDPGVIGRTVQLNKHPYTIIGVAQPGFHGTLFMFAPDFFMPFVNQEQIDGSNLLADRSTRSLFQILGHLKPGVTAARATDDVNSVGEYLAKTYPKIEAAPSFRLARPSLYGDFMGRPARAFMTGLTVLAGLILLAACANLGSLFAARAADRARELALRMALGSTRGRIMRQLFTEALLISAMGGAVGLWGSMMLLESLRTWEPVPRFPLSLPVNPDARVYGVALLLTIVSGFLFGAVPVKQVLQTDPYEIVKSGSMGSPRRRITVRDALLCVQIALCALLVTSSMVALRGLIRSLHSDFGFEPRGALLMDTVLDMAGYHGDQVPVMEKRMIDAMAAIPGVSSVGMIDWLPMANGSWHDSDIFTDETSDLKPANAASSPVMFNVSPGYFEAARTTLLAGRAFTWNDDKNAPRVAVVNEEFARRIFGSASNALGRHYKMPDGARIEVVGVAENGKYKNLTEDLQTAMFFPILQVPASQTSLIVRSDRDPQELAEAMRSTLRTLDAGLPSDVQPWQQVLDLPLFPARMATVSLGVLGAMGAMLSVTGIFGLAAYSVSKRKRELGIRIALGAQRKEVLEAALGRAFKLLALGSAAGLVLGLLASKVLSVIVYQATPRDPLVLAGVVLAMLLLGLVATWIPAQRALSVDPVMLMREE